MFQGYTKQVNSASQLSLKNTGERRGIKRSVRLCPAAGDSGGLSRSAGNPGERRQEVLVYSMIDLNCTLLWKEQYQMLQLMTVVLTELVLLRFQQSGLSLFCSSARALASMVYILLSSLFIFFHLSPRMTLMALESRVRDK